MTQVLYPVALLEKKNTFCDIKNFPPKLEYICQKFRLGNHLGLWSIFVAQQEKNKKIEIKNFEIKTYFVPLKNSKFRMWTIALPFMLQIGTELDTHPLGREYDYGFYKANLNLLISDMSVYPTNSGYLLTETASSNYDHLEMMLAISDLQFVKMLTSSKKLTLLEKFQEKYTTMYNKAWETFESYLSSNTTTL
jgi:hypothetical protein